jgi:hypothetical protein
MLISLCLIAAIGLTLGWIGRRASLAPTDSADYLSLSHSLAAGHYRDEFRPTTPPHAKYPPGLPAWLLIIQILAGGHLDAALMANFLLLLLLAYLTADILRRLGAPWLGVLAGSIVLVNPALLYLAGAVAPETLFATLSMLALWLTLAKGSTLRVGYSTLAVPIAVLSFLTRSIGLATIPAVLVPLALGRRWKSLLLGGALTTFVVLGWFGYARRIALHTTGSTYAADLVRIASPQNPINYVSKAVATAKLHLAKVGAGQFGIPDIHDQPVDNAISGVLLLVFTGLGMWALRKQWPAAVAYLGFSAAILVVYPWHQTRFLTPLVPVITIFTLVGAHWLAGRARIGRPDLVAGGLGLFLAGVGLSATATTAQAAWHCRLAAPASNPRCDAEGHNGFRAASEFIRDSLPREAVITTSKPAYIFLASGHRSVLLDPNPSKTNPYGRQDGTIATYVLLTRLLSDEADRHGRDLLSRCESVELTKQFPVGAVLVRPVATGERPTRNACAALRQLVGSAAAAENAVSR